MKTKLLGSFLLVLAVLFLQVGNVVAAPQIQDATPITGTVQSIATEVDANGVTTVLVTLEDGQTIPLSVDTAVTLGLVSLDPNTGAPVVDQTKVGQTVEIDPTTVIPGEEEQDVHPIAALLGNFFGEDPSVVQGYHEDGFGFGVIAQAMWMSQGISGDASVTAQILEAKQTGDYSAFTLPDGTTPKNWGQFKQALKENKDKHNLGVVVSGHGNNNEDEAADQQDHGNNGNGNGKDKDKDKGNGKDKNKNKP